VKTLWLKFDSWHYKIEIHPRLHPGFDKKSVQ